MPAAASAPVSRAEAERRNEEQLLRVLGDFAMAKASGALDDVDEDEELEGEEGVDWVWWRADDTATASSASSATTPSSRGSATHQAARNDQESVSQQQQQQHGQGQAGSSGPKSRAPTTTLKAAGTGAPLLVTPGRKRPIRTSVYKPQSSENLSGEASQ